MVASGSAGVLPSAEVGAGAGDDGWGCGRSAASWRLADAVCRRGGEFAGGGAAGGDGAGVSGFVNCAISGGGICGVGLGSGFFSTSSGVTRSTAIGSAVTAPNGCTSLNRMISARINTCAIADTVTPVRMNWRTSIVWIDAGCQRHYTAFQRTG